MPEGTLPREGEEVPGRCKDDEDEHEDKEVQEVEVPRGGGDDREGEHKESGVPDQAPAVRHLHSSSSPKSPLGRIMSTTMSTMKETASFQDPPMRNAVAFSASP